MTFFKKKKTCKTLTNVRIWNRFSVLHILSENIFIKESRFIQKSHISGIFKKSVLDFKDTVHIDYENISTVLCISEGEQMIKLDRAATNQNCKFEGGGGGVFVSLRKYLAEYAYKSIYKGTLVLPIYDKNVGIRLAGHPADTNKRLVIILFSGV